VTKVRSPQKWICPGHRGMSVNALFGQFTRAEAAQLTADRL
jgi:hypothetical protein